MNDLVLFLILLGIGYYAGRAAEARHFRSLRRREEASRRMEITTAKGIDPSVPVTKAFLVTGCTVVSADYFKRIAAALRNLFGGRVSAYESLLDRARRESILRMKKQALEGGASRVVNVRLETSSISNAKGRGRKIVGVEVLAFGTALKTR